MKPALIKIFNLCSIITQGTLFEDDSSTADTARIIFTAYRLFILSDRTQIGRWFCSFFSRSEALRFLVVKHTYAYRVSCGFRIIFLTTQYPVPGPARQLSTNLCAIYHW